MTMVPRPSDHSISILLTFSVHSHLDFILDKQYLISLYLFPEILVFISVGIYPREASAADGDIFNK